MTTLPPNYLRLSSTWLETNPLPEDAHGRTNTTPSGGWFESAWRGKMLPWWAVEESTYATARTDLPREAYADDEIRPMTAEERKALDEFTMKELRSEPGAEVASERAEEKSTVKMFRWSRVTQDNGWDSILNPYGTPIARDIRHNEAIDIVTMANSGFSERDARLETAYHEMTTIRAQLEAKEAEVRELQGWKESAIAVMPPYQEIGEALGLTLGQSVHDKILPEIGKLLAENDKLLAECRELRELSERRAETIAVAMHNQKVADQDHASTVSSIRSENDKLRAEVEHRAKQRDAFQNLFSEASEAFNERGRQIARLTAELDAVRKELRNRDESIAAKRKYIEKCNHLPELVIDSESGPICCECWAIEEKSRADKWQTILEANNDLMPTGVDFYFCVEEFFRQVRGMWNEQMDVLRNCGTAIVKAESERDAAQARCGDLENLAIGILRTLDAGCEVLPSDMQRWWAAVNLTPSQQPDNLKGGDEPCGHESETGVAPAVLLSKSTADATKDTSVASNPQPESPIPSGVGHHSRPEPVKAGEWLPMETAPKRKVLLRIQTSPDAFRTVEALWINGQWDFDGMLFFKPVGWKPIAPEGKATEGEG